MSYSGGADSRSVLLRRIVLALATLIAPAFAALTVARLPTPRLAADFDATMRFALSHSGPGAPDIRIPAAFVRTDPFAGLTAP